MTTQRFYGKYRGRVTDNEDPLKLGRIRAKVTDIYGDESCGWALPCFPLAAPGKGVFMVPPVDAWVWIEFEYGDSEKPIWTGCFYPDDPIAAGLTVTQLLPMVGVETDKLAIKTDEWLITIESSKVAVAALVGPVARSRLEITSSSAKLTNDTATVELTGPSVKVNYPALEVT